MSKIRYRQVHLDFHTSEYIPDIAADFDKDEFAKTLEEAHVDSITCLQDVIMDGCTIRQKIPGAHPPGIEEQKLFTGADRGVS